MKYECPNCGDNIIPCSCVENYRRKEQLDKMYNYFKKQIEESYNESIEIPEDIETSEQFIDWVRSLDNQNF